MFDSLPIKGDSNQQCVLKIEQNMADCSHCVVLRTVVHCTLHCSTHYTAHCNVLHTTLHAASTKCAKHQSFHQAGLRRLVVIELH